MSQQTTEPGDAVAAALADSKARRDEYAEWVCGPDPIMYDGARAFNPGDRVPASHITRGIVDADQVVRVGDAPPPVLARPADSGALDKWRAYAIQEGMPADEAAAVDDKAVFVKRYPKVEG